MQFNMFLLQNPQLMMGMNQGMMGMNNNMNMFINNLKSMGFNDQIINNFINYYNQQNQQNFQNQQNNNNSGFKNIIFKDKKTNATINIPVSDDESIGSILNKYITKSGNNHVNIYIVNGKRLDERKTVRESDIIDNTVVEVVSVDDLEGAKIL